MNSALLDALREEEALADVPDDELMAAVQARLPRYILRRSIVRLPLLLLGLVFLVGAGIHGTDVDQPDLAAPAPPAHSSTSTDTAGVSVPPSPPASRTASTLSRPVPTTGGTTESPPVSTEPSPRQTDSVPPRNPPSDPPSPCAAQPAVDASSEVLHTLKEATGIVPAASTTLLLANVTGCAQDDPAIVLLGVLVEVGHGLPDPGVDIPDIPLPLVELPPTVVDALQPLGPAIGPACENYGILPAVILLGLSSYPAGIDGAALTVINQVTSVCAQLSDS